MSRPAVYLPEADTELFFDLFERKRLLHYRHRRPASQLVGGPVIRPEYFIVPGEFRTETGPGQ